MGHVIHHAHIYRFRVQYVIIPALVYVGVVVFLLSATRTEVYQNPHSIQTSITQVELPTTELVNEFTRAGFNPVVLGDVHRPFFSVSGKLVTLGQDNFQVFEYPSIEMASSEIAAFMQDVDTPTGRWKNNALHLYRKNSTVVYYMGNKPSVLAVLEGIFK